MKPLRIVRLLCLSIFLFQTVNSSGQEFLPYYGDIVNSCSYDTLLSNLQIFENAGVKEVGSFAISRTLDWIISKYESYGYTDIQEKPFEHAGLSASNIVITKTGSRYPDTYLIIDGHYDTRRGAGANDNGSGTVAILEIARLLINIETEYSIKFIHFSAEEVGLVGSWHYVEHIVLPGQMDIKLVFNIDGIGGVNGLLNNKITCDRDETGPPFTNNEASAILTGELANCVTLYSTLTPQFGPAAASDHVPFEIRNFVITGFYESNISPYNHSSDDVIDNLDVAYIYEVTKAAIGASLHFAGAVDATSSTTKNDVLPHLIAYPNPVRDYLNVDLGATLPEVKLILTNSLGQEFFRQDYKAADQIHLDLDEQITGLYLLKLELPSGESKTLIIFKE